MKRKAEQYLVIDYLREMTERIKQECKASSLGGCRVPVLWTQGNPFSSRPSPSFLRPLLAWRLRMVGRFFNFIHGSGTVPWRSAPSSFSGMTCHNHHGSVLEFRTFKYLQSQNISYKLVLSTSLPNIISFSDHVGISGKTLASMSLFRSISKVLYFCN